MEKPPENKVVWMLTRLIGLYGQIDQWKEHGDFINLMARVYIILVSVFGLKPFGFAVQA